MQYSISRNSKTSQFIQIVLHIACEAGESVNLQLAAWRPGRYELANYAQKIRGLKVHFDKKNIPFTKLTKDLWSFSAISKGIYEIHYEYHANQMDAGGCWSDDEQLYLNFSNFIFEVKNRESEAIELTIELPSKYIVATPLSSLSNNIWAAKSYQHVMDSPFVASEQLIHFTYSVQKSTFHLWFNGEIHFDTDYLIKQFESFTQLQIEAFGEFPAENYHFIFQLLPYKHYHGVEHQFSTVITFGPAISLAEHSQLTELVGVSSHELYHFWNVCRIRPKGILQYDLSKEVYLDTGLVLEGVTTYMGDLYLLQSGFFSLEEYCEQILDKLLQKEFDGFGWQNQSIVASSLDLWLDGYKIGIPDKKVSIYNRGALIALYLDLILIKNGSSLSQVMKKMWIEFGKKEIGYELSDFRRLIGNNIEAGEDIPNFFEKYVYGNENVLPKLKGVLLDFGIEIREEFDKENKLLHDYGVRVEGGIIKQIHPNSDAYKKLMLNDLILRIGKNDLSMSLALPEDGLLILVKRHGRELTIKLAYQELGVFPKFRTKIKETNNFTNLWTGKKTY